MRRKIGLVVHYSYNGSYRFCYSSRGTPGGSTPSLLLLHGFSASKDMWLTLVPVSHPLQTQPLVPNCKPGINFTSLFHYLFLTMEERTHLCTHTLITSCWVSAFRLISSLSPLHQFLPESQHVVCLDMPGHEGTSRTGPEDYSIPGQVHRVHQVCVSASPGNIQAFLLYNMWRKGQSSPFEALSSLPWSLIPRYDPLLFTFRGAARHDFSSWARDVLSRSFLP